MRHFQLFQTGITVAATLFTSIAIAFDATPAHPETGVIAERSGVIETGFLFVDGKYIAAPYQFRSDEHGVFVNDQALHITSLGLVEQDFWKWDMVPQEETATRGAAAEVRFRRTAIRPRHPWRYIASGLHNQDVVVVAQGEPLTSLYFTTQGIRLLDLLANNTERGNVSPAELSAFGEINQPLWHEWISNFVPSEGFLARAAAEITARRKIQEANHASARANVRLDKFSYPLTVIAMVLIALAVGHLMSNRPPMSTTPEIRLLTAEENRAIVYSLLLVVFLSALDLAWTVLAYQANAMKELNPIGAGLLDSPLKLVFFKVLATLIGTGLLFGMRRFVFARRATWWCCLVCTLLAARWVSVSSVMV